MKRARGVRLEILTFPGRRDNHDGVAMLNVNISSLTPIFDLLCSSRVNRALDAGNIPPVLGTAPFAYAAGGLIEPSNLSGSAGMRALAGGAIQAHIPQGTTSLPSSLGQFMPKR